MIVLWTLFMTLSVAQPLTDADSRYYADLCTRSGGAAVRIGGNFGENPKEPHTARLVECLDKAPESEAAAAKPNV